MITIKERDGTFFKREGEGPTVVFIHGVGMDHKMWSPIIFLLKKNYQVISYDMLGHGASKKIKGTVSIFDFASQLKQLLMNLEVERAHLVGFSMGGFVAQALAILHPECVETLTLMNVVADRSEDQQKSVAARVEQVRENGHKSTIEPAISRWFTSEFVEKQPETIQKVRKRLELNDYHSYLAAYSVFAKADQDLWPRLSEIKHPCLILTGENDMGSTVGMSLKMEKVIRNSKVIIVTGQKHMLPLELPQKVAKLLMTFFKENE
ncbi:alpha/beta fold hydrolase [Shouchella rhizosphaerae]|uniref:alpha/beta fold hydrolase n=1 Tax=Shouchella rhizosphaerae TaxID=866786 RepID=UPI003F7E4D21